MNRYRLMRFERGMTLADVAAGAGVSERTLIRLEQGAEPGAVVAKALAAFYGTSVADLLGLPSKDLAA